MKSPADIILELESDNSRLFKESVIIREMQNNNDEFFEGVELVCNKLITFGLKQIPERNGEDSQGISWYEFKRNVNKLIVREITGNAARELVENLMNQSTNHQWNNWYSRILIKDLRCGVDEKTVNKCAKQFPKYKIPVFSCQLAYDSNLHEGKMIGEKIIDSKMDGARLLTIVYPNGRVNQFSRNGKEIVNFPHVIDQFTYLSGTLDEPMVFDGEMMSSSFQDLMTQFYRKETVNTTDSILYLFDMIPLEDFSKGIYKVKQINRLEKLHNWVKIHKEHLPNVNILEYEVINLSDDFGKKRFNEINNKALELGLEGIMIKDPNAAYECKRSTAWLKMKPTKTIDLEIVDLQEGTDKYEGMLGALVCQGIEDDKEIFVNVGSGFTDEERKQYWINKSDVIGKIAEVKCDAITQNKNGTYSLRFPRFSRLRGFDKHEKI